MAFYRISKNNGICRTVLTNVLESIKNKHQQLGVVIGTPDELNDAELVDQEVHKKLWDRIEAGQEAITNSGKYLCCMYVHSSYHLGDLYLVDYLGAKMST